MARRIGSSGSQTEAAIREAGLRLIYRHGFAAASLQHLAAEVGIQKSSIYNHIESKQDLLFKIVKGHMDDLLYAVSRDLPEIGLSPPARLEAFVHFHVLYHAERSEEMFVINSELRSLDPENLVCVLGLRAQYEQVLFCIMREGEREGKFRLMDARIATFGILAMLSSVGTWFKSSGRLSKEEVAAVFSDMVLRSVIV
ncbi:MAG: TetR/AcrR family transcriptional regulator [Janthinobacterium lividum]